MAEVKIIMKNPRLNINLEKITHNTKSILKMCKTKKIEVIGVSKGCCADEQVVQAMLKGGIKTLGDSRIQNLKKLKDASINAEMMLIRIPMHSELKDVVEYADISLNSEIATIEKISDIAKKKNKEHKIILMIEMGDLREGVIAKEAPSIIKKINQLPKIKLLGIGANFSCVSGVLPSKEKLDALVSLAIEIERKVNIDIKVISGGSTSALKLVEENTIPDRINQLRIGTGILMGQDDIHVQNLKGTYQDAFTLTAEIVEVKMKPSFPSGKIGRDAFGQVPEFKDIGLRKRAILAIGKQDIYLTGLIPLKDSIQIIAASSDHLIIDVTDYKGDVEVGGEVEFKLNYPALLSATTSKYISKYYN